VKAELLPLSSLSADDIRRWQELSDTASEPNPFFEPAYVLAAQEALAEPDVSLLVARGGGEAGWSLCMPVVKRWRWRRAPVPGLVAWRHIYSYLGTPLMAAGSERRSADALLDWLRPPACSSFLGVDLLHRDGPVYAALAAAAEAHERGLVAYEEIERASMEAHDGVGSLAINRKHQREAARMRRRLADELGTPVATRDRAGEPEAVEAFLALEASGWKGQEGTAIATIGHGDFLREVCSAFHRVGRLQLISFETEGRHAVPLQDRLRRGAGAVLAGDPAPGGQSRVVQRGREPAADGLLRPAGERDDQPAVGRPPPLERGGHPRRRGARPGGGRSRPRTGVGAECAEYPRVRD
jgi:hypothetical protein